MSAASAVRELRGRAGHTSTRRIGRLFMAGSACFALASLPGASSLSADAVGVTYFIGSIFFTSAALGQLGSGRSLGRLDFLASAIQLAGTLFFNISTFTAMSDELSTKQAALLVWAPDAFGSACFLVASALALFAVWRDPFFAPARRVARLNMIGSIAFGLSAIGGYIVPDTGDLLDASVATSGTLIGALCFFYGAFILAKRVAPSE